MLYVKPQGNFAPRSTSLDELELTAGDRMDSMPEPLPNKEEIKKVYPGRSVKLAEYIKHRKQGTKGYKIKGASI